MKPRPAYVEPSVEFGQQMLKLWQDVTSKPLTSREIEFARRVMAATQEYCAAVAGQHFAQVCVDKGKKADFFTDWNAAASIRAIPPDTLP